MSITKDEFEEIVEDKLKEALKVYKKVTGDLDNTLEQWLVDRFRPNFQIQLAVDPEKVWKEKGDWVKRQTRAMAHFAKALAMSEDKDKPELKHIEEGVRFIQKTACAAPKGPHPDGGWCSAKA